MVAAADLAVAQLGSVFLPTLEFDWAWSNYGDAFTDFRDQIVRSFGYAGLATLICLASATRWPT